MRNQVGVTLSKRTATLISLCLCFLASLILFTFSNIIGDKAPDYSNQYSAILNSFGGTLLSISVLGLVYDFALKEKLVDVIKSKLGESIEEKFQSVNQLRESGIDNAYTTFPEEEVVACFGKAEFEITIVQTWLPEDLTLSGSIISALDRNCKVNIYLVEPGSVASRQRSMEIYGGNEEEEYQVSLYTSTSVRRLRNVVQNSKIDIEKKKNLRIFFYSGTPTMAIYRADDTAFVGFYFRNTNSKHGSHFKINSRHSSFGKNIQTHIDGIRENAPEVEEDFRYELPQKTSI